MTSQLLPLFGVICLLLSSLSLSPNVRIANAAEVCQPTINFGETIQCSIDSGGERDSYTFTAVANDKIVVRMTRTTGEITPEVKVYDSRGVEVCGSYGAPTAHIYGCQLSSTGTFTIRAFEAFGRKNTGNYSLYLQRLNNPGNAKPLGFGQTFTSVISTGGERNTYTFSAVANDRIDVRMTKTTGTLTPEIKVFNSRGVEVCGSYGSPTAHIYGCLLPQTGSYIILAFEAFDRYNTGDYTIYLQRLNNPSGARAIGFGETISGGISSGGERDTFTFTAAANDKIVVRMTKTTGDLTPEVKVFDFRGIEVCGSYGSPTAHIYGCQLPYNGTYTILAFEAFGRYNIGDYHMYLQRLNNSAGSESIGFGQTLNNSISTGGERDTYTFMAGANDKVLVRMTRTTGVVAPEVKIFNPFGVEVCGTYGDSAAQISNCSLPYDGTYTILTFEAFGRYNTGDYTLYLECLNTACGDSTPDCGIAPNGINTCALEPGDILIQKWNSIENVVFMGIGGTYFTHAAIYVGNGRIVQAVGPNATPAAQVIEQSLAAGGWTNAAIYDWVVIRPNTTTAVKNSAVEYARAKAADPNVTYSILADKNSELGMYCSQLIWKAYKQAGVDLEVDRGGTLTDIATLNRMVTPDDLFYSSGSLAQRSTKMQSKASSVDRTLWRWTLWILSPAHLMITDSQGRRTGFDAVTGTVLNEIPGVFYSGPDGAVETLTVTDPEGASANWRLIVTGYASGSYEIETGSVDSESPPNQVLAGTTNPGKVEDYFIPDPNSTGAVTIVDRQYIYLPMIQR